MFSSFVTSQETECTHGYILNVQDPVCHSAVAPAELVVQADERTKMEGWIMVA